MTRVMPALSALISLIVPASGLSWPAVDRLTAESLEQLSQEFFG